MQAPDTDRLPPSKIWEVSLTLEEKNDYKDAKRDYVLLKAGTADTQKVFDAYQHHGVVGYEIVSIEVVYNLHTEKAFESHSHKLQKRAGNPAFASKWERECVSPEETQWRGAVIKKWHSLSMKDTSCPDVNILPLWHGTNPAIVGSIFETGYANLATTDSGFFGKGLYFSREAEYAYRVYSHGEGKKQGQLGNGGVLLFNWVLTHSSYPVIYQDMDKLKEKGNYQNYDSHFIPVVPRSPHNPQEVNYYPCQRIDQDAVYHELVVFESAAVMPRYLITLQSTFLKSPEALSPNPMQLYQQGMAYKKGSGGVSQDFKKAFDCFTQAAKLNFPLGLLELGWCYKKGEGVQKDFDAAANCFGQATGLGLASAEHELGWCHKRGEGVPKDEKQAAIHFEKAADKGLPGAAFDLGCCYFSGTGVEKNRAKASYYFKKAADKGILAAQVRFAECCMNGDGVPKNYDKAIKYYRLAAEQGDKKSEEQLINLLSVKLTKLKQGQNRHILLPNPPTFSNPQMNSNPLQETNTPPDSNQVENCRLQ